MYIAIGQRRRAKAGRGRTWRCGKKGRLYVVAAGVDEGKPGKTQITINEGERQKRSRGVGRGEEGKKAHVGRNAVTSNSGRRMRVESVELSDNPALGSR